MAFSALLNTGMNSSFRNGYKPSRVSCVTSSEKLIHTMNQQRRILVDVHQLVRDLAGAVLADEHVGHRFTLEHSLIQAMEVCPLPSSTPNA
jgi:hypothetical protein